MAHECRIGSLSWFAGLFWLGLGATLHGAAWWTLYLRDGVTAVTYRLCDLAGACFRRASECAREGGATD